MIRYITTGLAAAGMVIAPVRLRAQSAIFLDRSYAVRMSPDRGLLYEALPAFPLFLNSRLDGLYASLADPTPHWSTGSMLVFTPMFRIRQVEEKESASQPVRLPSFMPKLTAQFLAARRIGGNERHPAELPLSAMIVGADVSFGHYSNGQAGCFRANQRPKADGSGGCEVDATAGPGADTLNTVDGSFSTWYFRGQTHLRFAHYRDSLPLVAFTLNAGVDWHPAFLEPIGGMDTSLAAVYGRLRPFGGAELMRQSEWPCAPTALLSWLPCGLGRLRASVNVEYIGTHPARVSTVATTSEVAWTFRRYAGLGALVRLHTGQDYYNMALGHELNVLQYGVTFDLERYDPIRRR